MTFKPALRVRAVADFHLAGTLAREGAALIVDQAEARRLVAAGLVRVETANGVQPWPALHTRSLLSRRRARAGAP